jgi:predicted SprT family Zn-dependent metalloprotease
MTVKQKEKLLTRFIESKAEEHDLMDWQFYYCDTQRKEFSYAHCIPQLRKIFIQEQSLQELSLLSLQDIVLHEMAHAITGSIAKHGAEFRKVCKQIGCKGNRANNYYECCDLDGKIPWQYRNTNNKKVKKRKIENMKKEKVITEKDLLPSDQASTQQLMMAYEFLHDENGNVIREFMDLEFMYDRDGVKVYVAISGGWVQIIKNNLN